MNVNAVLAAGGRDLRRWKPNIAVTLASASKQTSGRPAPSGGALARAGGPVTAIILILTCLFTVALFDLRAEKVFSLPASAAEAGAEDLVAFFRASDMLAQGRAADAYNAQAFREGMSERHKGMLWLNPPHALLLVAPLEGVSYASAKIALIALSALSFIWIAILTKSPFWRAATLVASPAAFASLLVLQTGPLVALGLLSAFLLAKSRPVLAGLLLALLTVKPQYGVMAPVFLAALGCWRAMGAAAFFAAMLAAISVAMFGVEPWIAFSDSIAGGAISAHGANLHRDMVSAGSTLMKLGAGGLSSTGQAAVIAVCATLTFIAARRIPREAAIGIALLSSAAASPSLWVYDWPLIAAGLFMLMRAGAPWPPLLQLAAGLLWIGPLYSLGLGTTASSLIAPALLAIALGLAFANELKAQPEFP